MSKTLQPINLIRTVRIFFSHERTGMLLAQCKMFQQERYLLGLHGGTLHHQWLHSSFGQRQVTNNTMHKDIIFVA